MADIILYILKQFGLAIAIAVVLMGSLVYYWIKNPGSFESFAANIFHILQKIIITQSDYFDKKRIKTSCESTIKKTMTEFSNKCEFIKPQEISIKWVEEGDNESALKDGTIYIRIKRTNNDEDNTINTMYLAIQASVLPDLKKIMNKEQQTSLDLYITYIFSLNMDKFHRNSFSKIYNPVLDSCDKLKLYFNQYDDLYKHGVFHGALMHELLCIEKENMGRIDMVDLIKLSSEINLLLQNLQNFVHRSAGIDEEKIYGVKGVYISCFMMIFAKKAKVNDITPHIDFIEDYITYDYRRCYIFSHVKLHNLIEDLYQNLRHICFVESQCTTNLTIHKNGFIEKDITGQISVLQRINKIEKTS